MTQVLNEVKKRQILDQSRYNVDDYEDQTYGKNRFQRRQRQKVANSNREFNLIDMNLLFKQDVLTFNVRVRGETDNYLVTLEFPGVIKELQTFIHPYEDINFRDVMRAVSLAFENNDIKTRCNCADFKYRIAYSLTQDGGIAGEEENRPALITNPNDTKGKGCKHILKVLNNTSWINKVSSVIRNYINYMQVHNEGVYAKVIFPALFGQEYNAEYQHGLFDDDDLQTGEADIDASNEYARTKNYFKKSEVNNTDEYNDNINIEGQKSFDFDSLDDEEEIPEISQEELFGIDTTQ